MRASLASSGDVTRRKLSVFHVRCSVEVRLIIPVDSLTDLEKQHSWHPFTPMRDWCAPDHEPLMLVSGLGCWLTDQHGNRYLDGNSSIWTNIHGHNHPRITTAIKAQLDRVAHTSFLGFTHPPAAQLAAELAELSPDKALNKVFFSDNGSTAIESAVRMALQYWKQNERPEREIIVAFDLSLIHI